VVTPSSSARVDALLSNEAQLADALPPRELERLEKEHDVRVLSTPSIRVIFLGFRVDRPPFSDRRVRRAVRLAVDKAEIIRRVLGGHATPATQLVPPAVAGYDPTIPDTPPDRVAARRLLLAAGYPDGLDVTLDGPSDRYLNDVEILKEIARQLADVGIRVTVHAMPKAAYFPYLRTDASNLYLLGWVCNTLWAGDAIGGLLRTRGTGEMDNLNYEGLSDPELDRLVASSARLLEPSARAVVISRALVRVDEEAYVVPLEIQHDIAAISRRIEWDPPVGQALYFADIKPAK
jgi:peptide/nickel transport system substrate-binding protein